MSTRRSAVSRKDLFSRGKKPLGKYVKLSYASARIVCKSKVECLKFGLSDYKLTKGLSEKISEKVGSRGGTIG